MSTKRNPKAISRHAEIAIDTPIDYTKNMFKDGNNRTRNNPDVRGADAEVYDDAVQHGDVADFSTSFEPAEVLAMVPNALSHESGKFNADEEGEPLGGTEEELDDMEAEGKPVDRTDRMKY